MVWVPSRQLTRARCQCAGYCEGGHPRAVPLPPPPSSHSCVQASRHVNRCCATFLVARERVLRLPIEFWAALYNWAQTTVRRFAPPPLPRFPFTATTYSHVKRARPQSTHCNARRCTRPARARMASFFGPPRLAWSALHTQQSAAHCSRRPNPFPRPAPPTPLHAEFAPVRVGARVRVHVARHHG